MGVPLGTLSRSQHQDDGQGQNKLQNQKILYFLHSWYPYVMIVKDLIGVSYF